MATTIKLKNGSGAPLAGDLVAGEPALDLTNKRLYTEDSGGTVIEVGTNPGEDVTFADNRKAVFGNGSDLQIYHASSQSYIEDAGSGNLNFKSNGNNFNFLDGSDNVVLQIDMDSATTLYHNTNEKLATTATGIDVTGGIGATSDSTFTAASGDIYVTASTGSGSGRAGYRVDETANNGFEMAHDNADNAFFISRRSGSSTVVDALKIDRSTGDFSLFEDTGTTPKFHWDASAESLGIGTDSPEALLHLSGSNPQIRFSDTTNANYNAIVNLDGNMIYKADVDNQRGNSRHRFEIDGSEKMRIDSDGNVGIGTDNPATLLHLKSVSAPTLKIDDSDSTFALELTQDGPNGSMLLKSSGTLSIGVANNSSSDTVSFQTQSTERMRLTSSGELLLGKTSVSANTAGIELHSNGLLRAVKSGAEPLIINRTTDDGSLISLRKNNVTVGSIGVSSTNTSLYMAKTNTGIMFWDAQDAITPCNDSGTVLNNSIDLGTENYKFKDLYLSGGAYLGGTAAANKLDDYEEGTWTPAPNSGTLNAGATGSYVKIGNLVHVQGQLSFSANGTTNRIDGLPFRPRIEANLRNVRQQFLIYSNGSSTTAIYGYCQDVNNAVFLINEDKTAHNFDTADDVYTFAFTYET